MSTTTTAPPSDPLARRAGRAFGWSLANTLVSRLGTLAIGIVLARLLGPTEFGAFAVATVALLAVLSFNELGVSLAIVRWPTDPAAIAPTVATVSTVTSAALFAVVLATAHPFASIMGAPQAAGVVQVLGIAIVVNGIVATPAALLQRDFSQGRRLVVDQVNTWLGAAVSVLCAVAGLGAMSLAIGRVTGAVVSGLLFVRWSPVPLRFGFDRSIARSLLRFGLPLAGSSIVVFAVGYADQLTVGTILGATALGFYVLAFNLSSWPVSVFSGPLRSVAPAAFARITHDVRRSSQAFADVLQLLTSVALPACVLLGAAAVPLVALVYGPAWSSASQVLAFLAVGAAARIFFELAYDFLVVRGRSGPILVVQLMWIVALVPAVLLGARLDGIRGVAIAQAAVSVLVVVPAYVVLLHRAGVRASLIGRRTWSALLVSAAVGIAVWLVAGNVTSSLLACAASGGIALVGVAALLFMARPVLARAAAARRTPA